MENTVRSRFKKAWNAFFNKDPTYKEPGPSYSFRESRAFISHGNERTIINSIYNRIALDVAQVDFRHVRLDENGRFKEEMDTELNNCLKLSANLDQTGRAFFIDAVLSMFDEGYVAMIPVDTDIDPRDTKSFDVLSLRTGKILQWYPEHVRVRAYNERTGQREEVTLPKESVAIVENPFYQIMNAPNSTLQRLTRKLNLLDRMDESSCSGKLDLIIQLPYVIKTDARRQQAESRRKDIEQQLSGSKYGIAYTDGTEHITQLNRPVENTLLSQIEYLTKMVFSQIGITQEILDGTADTSAMTNYYSRVIEPILCAFAEEMERKFLSLTARTQGQAVRFYRDPFKLLPVESVAEMADKMTRNEIMTSNEIRQVIGMKPSEDPKADELVNANINQSKETEQQWTGDSEPQEKPDGIQNGN